MNIEELYEMLDWNNSMTIQKEGIELAKKEKNIEIFFQPMFPNYNKNIWDNCAIIVSDKDDKELEPYLYKLFEWLQDINWPGAETILNRLNNFKKNEIFFEVYKKCIDEAILNEDDSWLLSINEIKI